MAKHLTDKQKKKIIADYIECENYSEVARKYDVNPSTIKRIVDADPYMQKKAEQKKEQNTLDVLDYLDSKTQRYKNFTDYLLDKRLDPKTAKDALNELSEMQLVTMFGVLTDKLLKAKEIKLKNKVDEGVEKINDNLLTLAKIIKNPQEPHEIKVDKNE